MITVIQLGPRRSVVGGMSSVVDTYSSALDRSRFITLRIATFGYSRRAVELVQVILAAIRLCLQRLRKRPVVHVHLSQGGSFLREGSLVRLANLIGCGTVVTIHGSRFDDYFANHENTVSKVLSAAGRIIVLTSSAHTRVSSLGLADRCVVLNNAVEVARTVQPPELETPTVLFAGEIGVRKGVDVLVEAWPLVLRQVPDARLIIVGPVGKGQDAVYQAALATLSVELPGVVSQAKVRDMLARSTLAVLPSRAEAMPKFILEAMASGRPVVATSVGAVQELVDDSVGRIVCPGSAEMLVNTLVELLTRPELCLQLGGNAHQRAYSTYRAEIHMEMLAGIYVGVLEKSKNRAEAL